MSLSRAQQSRLGAFMIAGGVLAVVFVAIPLGFKFAERDKTYYAAFEGESLSGLDQGAVVKYYGVPIGKVEKVMFDADNIERVRVEIRIRHDFPVKEGMYIQTGMLGITGLKYVEILGGSNEASPLKPGSTIPVKLSLMATLTGKTDVIIEKIELLLNNITNFTHPDTLAALKQILDNVADITEDVEVIVRDVQPDIGRITASTVTTMQKVDLIASDVRGITANLNTAVNPVRLGEMIAAIDSTARTVKNLSQDLNLTIRQTREDFTVSMENLRETLENANELSKILAENPSLLLRSEQQKERTIR